MLKKLDAWRGVFAPKGDQHPLADANELRRLLAEIPQTDPRKTLDDIVGWLSSLRDDPHIPGDQLFEAARQLDEMAQPALRRVLRDYLNTPRQSKAEEKRLWNLCQGFHLLQVDAYERCLAAIVQKSKSTEVLKPSLPLILCRLIGGLTALLKWAQFHYVAAPAAVWEHLGHALHVAEQFGLAAKGVTVYAGQSGMTTPQLEFVKAVAFQAASMSSLLPAEIDLAERLLGHVLGDFVFTAQADEFSVYWLDLAAAKAPQRLARLPAEVVPTLRFFKPAKAHERLQALLHRLEQGAELPPELTLGVVCTARQLIPVLRHLAAYLAPIPPQRNHDRHRVKHRMSVLNGLINAFVVFSGEFGGRPAGLQMESWVVENVSRGGFGAVLNHLPAEWLRVGGLLAIQPEGGENWLLGIVRRYQAEGEGALRVGIETLARRASAIELRAYGRTGFGAAAPIPALLLHGGPAEEVQLVLPAASFDLRESLEWVNDGRRYLLSPVTMSEQTADYEVARYRIRVLA